MLDEIAIVPYETATFPELLEDVDCGRFGPVLVDICCLPVIGRNLCCATKTTIVQDVRFETMSRRCELTGKAVMTGNNVSHANNKTRRRFLPNLVNVTLMSDALQQKIKLRIAAAALRTVEHRGGLDAFLMKAKEAELSPKAQLLRRQVQKKLAEVAA